MKAGLVLAAIGANFGLGWLLTWWVGGRAVGPIWVSVCLALLWAPFYWFCRRRFQAVFWPIVFFPNPFVALCFMLTLACATGRGCL